MAHDDGDDGDDGDDTKPHVVPIASPAPTGVGSSDSAETGPASQGGEGTGPWALGDLHAFATFAVGGMFAEALEASPAAGTLFGAIQTLPQEDRQRLSSAIADALYEAVRLGSGKQLPSPEWYALIPVAFWCPKGHLLFQYVTLTTSEGPQCPDHHEELELLYTRKKQG
jgi:hypothetical protein